MDDTAQTNSSRTLGRFFSWQTFRRGSIGLVVFATLIALLYSVEHWRGKRAWEAYKKEQETKGVRFDLAAFVPPQIPDEENFAMWPALEPMFHLKPIRSKEESELAIKNAGSMLRIKNVGSVKADWAKGMRVDFGTWWETSQKHRGSETTEVTARGGHEKPIGIAQKHRGSEATGATTIDHLTRAQQAALVLTALKEDERLLEEVQAASQRPRARFDIRYDTLDPMKIPLPHLTVLRSFCQALAVRASAELAAARSSDASRDADLIFYLAGTIKEEPLLISHLVRIACLHYGIQIIWEGLAENQWSDVQLREWQARFLEINLLAETRRSLEGDRAIGEEFIKAHGKPLLEALVVKGGRPDDLSTLELKEGGLIRFFPRGWVYFEQLNFNRLFHERILSSIDPESQRIHGAMIRTNKNEVTNPIRAFLRHETFARALLPALATTPLRAARLQSGLNQAATACALERYRRVHGSYPETLNQLLPKFLERILNDAMNGEPLKYRRDADGSFVLYSVGSDERDDGGSPLRPRSEEGDWVWRYSPPPPVLRSP